VSWNDIPSLNVVEAREFYNYDEFKQIGYVDWPCLFPRPQNMRATPTWGFILPYVIFVTDFTLELASELIRTDRTYCRWTTIVGTEKKSWMSPGVEDPIPSLYFCFTDQKDAALFRMLYMLDIDHKTYSSGEYALNT
jgi:hypothetical protein